MTTNDTKPAPKSLVLHSMAGYYDLLAAFLTLGRERELRARLAALANIGPGESVLDAGCGTGSLAIAAKRLAGVTGTVIGVDASPEMIDHARRKARRAGADVDFQIARAESLPFPDASFDVVLSTLMMHHLPRAVRELFAAEILRVLRPDGRVLVVDFEKPSNTRGGLISRLHRHGHVPLRDVVDLLGRTGLGVGEMGSVGVSDLRYALATKPLSVDEAHAAASPVERSLPPLPAPKWLWGVAIVVLVAAHLIVIHHAWTALALGTVVSIAIAALGLAHLGIAGGAARLARRHLK